MHLLAQIKQQISIYVPSQKSYVDYGLWSAVPYPICTSERCSDVKYIVFEISLEFKFKYQSSRKKIADFGLST